MKIEIKLIEIQTLFGQSQGISTQSPGRGLLYLQLFIKL
jgi:hypothetical protein